MEEETAVEIPSNDAKIPNVEVDEDKETIDRLEEMFKHRFTEEDQEFMAVMNKEDEPPPVIANFLDLRHQRDKDDHSRRDDRHRSDRRDGRDRSREERSRGDHRRDRSRSPHKHNTPRMPNGYYFYYY